MMVRVSWGDLQDEEDSGSHRPLPLPKPPRLRAKRDPTMPFLATTSLYNDIRSHKISENLAISGADHLEDVSPTAEGILWAWLRSIAPLTNRVV